MVYQPSAACSTIKLILETQMEFIRWSNPDGDFMHRVHDFLTHELDAINAFGLDWLRERLHAKQKHDRRLETALGRHGTLRRSTFKPKIDGSSWRTTSSHLVRWTAPS
jgi:hypothetical protein